MHYPEIVGPILLINAPRAAEGVYNKLVKPFMDPVRHGHGQQSSNKWRARSTVG